MTSCGRRHRAPLDAANARIWVHALALLQGGPPQATPEGSLIRYDRDPQVPTLAVCPPPAILQAACRRIQRSLAHQHGAPTPHTKEHDLEARTWLKANPTELPLAPNRFDSAAAARTWVESLYAAGAIWVEAAEILIVGADDEEYARMLMVSLPHAPADATALMQLLNREVRRGGCQIEPWPASHGFSL